MRSSRQNTVWIALLSAVSLAAQAAGPTHMRPKAPSLDGLWTNGSYTRLQRPKSLTGLVMSPEAAKTFEASLAKSHGVPPRPNDTVGQNDSEFPELGEGMARIRGEIRTSWIIEPADGRIPYTAEAKARLHIDENDPPESFDNPEDRPQAERCVSSAGSSPPLLSAFDANMFQFVQTADHLVVVSEKNHDVRVIPFNAAPPPRAPPTWAGNSAGRWEGNTLVVETSGLRQPLIDRAGGVYYSGDAKVSERFTRISTEEVLYEFTVTDPATFTQPWKAEMLFRATKGPLYEYACHEGNYSLTSILSAARQGNQPSGTGAPPK